MLVPVNLGRIGRISARVNPTLCRATIASIPTSGLLLFDFITFSM
jgi:hypothetical protein